MSTNKDDYDRVLDPEFIQSQVMPIENALVAILAASVYADDKAKPVELIELDALINRNTTLKLKTEAERQRICDDMYPLVKQKSTRGDQVKLACASVLAARDGKHPAYPVRQERIAESVFAHACDLLCSDLSVPAAERRFLGELRAGLQIEETRARQIMLAIALKNKF